MKRNLLLLACAVFAAGAWGDLVWQTDERGIARIEASIKGQVRNLVDEGQHLGEVHLRTEVGVKVAECHTATVAPAKCERQENRFARVWRTDSGLVLGQEFTRQGDSIFWKVVVKNPTAEVVKVTDLGVRLPLCSVTRKVTARQNFNRQECVNGGAAWILWTPFDGEGTGVALVPSPMTRLEFMTPEGWFYLHSRSRLDKPEYTWRVPRTEVTLKVGEERVYEFELFMVKERSEFPKELVKRGGVDVKVAPGMTIPRGEQVRIAFNTRDAVKSVVAEHAQTSQVALSSQSATAVFDRLGENRIEITCASGRTFTMDFFVTEELETVAKKRAAFIVKYQQTKDKSKWYDGLYSLYDLKLKRALSPEFLGGCHPFMVGGSDDPSNSKPIYLSEKNVVYPNPEEIASLEYYEQNFVWGKLQRTDEEYPYPCGIYGSDNWHENRSGRAGDYNSGGNGRERMWRTFDYVTHIATYYNLHRIAKDNPGLVHYLDAKGYLRRAWLTAMAYFEVPYNIKMGNQWDFKGWCEWAYTQGNFHERYILDLLEALEAEGWRSEAAKLRREWEKKVTYMVYENPWPFGSEMFVDRTAFESSYYVGEYALTRAMVPQEMFWYDKNRSKWYSYQSYPQGPKEAFMRNQLQGNLTLRGIYTTSGYNRCGTAWTDNPGSALEYMTQMAGTALLDHATRFAEGAAQADELRWGYNSLLASWALVNCGDAESGYGYWHPGPAYDGAAAWNFMGFVRAGSFVPGHIFDRGIWTLDGEIDHGFTGGVHGSACYLVTDPVFGELAYGGRLTSDAKAWRVVPWDLARRTLVVPQANRFELRLRQNGFVKGAEQMLARDLSSFTLTLEKRVQLATQTIDFVNLPKGEWQVESEGKVLATFKSNGGKTSVSFPFAANLQLRR